MHSVAALKGHEGEGSVTASLKARGLCHSLSAGAGSSHSDFARFGVTVMLTTAGMVRWQEVADTIFGMIAILHNSDAGSEHVQRQWEEIRQISGIKFRFQQKLQPYGYTASIAKRLHLHGARV
jgi:secreted Zn-dependent insulinase-like peptidase